MKKKAGKVFEPEFIITEEEGDIPIDEWFIPALEQFARQKYGLMLKVWADPAGPRNIHIKSGSTNLP